MPRRTATPATPAPPAPLPPPPRDLALLDDSHPQWAANLRILRRHWKWANFSQFFYTFAPLLAMPDVFLADVEDDLARGTTLYLPRIMHRLLYTLSQDRKLNIDNWQSALRRQYLRRDPSENPIGPEPKVLSRDSSLSPSEDEELDHTDNHHSSHSPNQDVDTDGSERKPNIDSAPDLSHVAPNPQTKVELADVPLDDIDEQPPKVEDEEEESKDWLDLSMLQKLDSLHLLTEWQFQNPHKLRQLMKDDDEAADWRIEPIGYDAKTNAYWLIGPDRLWIQRAPPKPPRNRTLKRKRPVAPKKSSPSKVARSSSDDEDDEPVAPSKRTRVQPQSLTRSQPQTNGRATRASRRAAQSSGSSDLILSGKSTRAAKVQANKKLDLQAKELAEFQRQAAALASSRARTSPRKSRGAPASPAKRTVGTRVSARLRSSTKGGDDDDEDHDEWQQVPEEWLQERVTPERRTRTRRQSKGKVKALPEEEFDEDEAEADGEAEADAGVEVGVDGGAQAEVHGDKPEDDPDREPIAEMEGQAAETGNTVDAADEAAQNTNEEELLQKAGLESGTVSDLTDLSDAEEEEDAEETVKQPRTRRRRNTRKTAVRKSARQTQRTKTSIDPNAMSKFLPDTESEEDEQMDEPPAPPLPEDFVEWEAIAITLSEWEHVADPFEKATHYLEKALYKMLTKNIIPLVTADLIEAEKKRRIEEAVVHRKRSSRIALKESEKEEARLAAKKKEEDEKKFARERRQEARRKKEEDERTKRESAREQRRKEREDREARAQAKAEREEAAAARSTATPSINGTQQSSSLLPSRVVTPSGVRTPDWMLDCEICHKQGLNVDDGRAMVSCGSCNRWQHIVCHDLHDQRVGRPRRDWEKQQFFCARCRQRMLNSGGYSSQGHQGYPAQQQQYGWQQNGRPIHLHKPGGIDPFAHTSDLRYSQRSPIENNVSYPQQYTPNSLGGTSYPRSSYPNAGLSFNHYQPDQRGPSSRPLPSTSQASWGGGNGYLSGAEQLGRMGSSQFAPQYPQNGGSMYPGDRIASAYQNQSSSAHSQFTPSHEPVMGMSSARWPSTSSNGYHSPTSTAVQEAAQSLAFMHDRSSSSRYSTYGQHLPTTSQPHHSSYPLSPAPAVGIDPLTGHRFATTPRMEQHIGHGLSHSSSASSFNFPS